MRFPFFHGQPGYRLFIYIAENSLEDPFDEEEDPFSLAFIHDSPVDAREFRLTGGDLIPDHWKGEGSLGVWIQLFGTEYWGGATHYGEATDVYFTISAP